MNPDELLDNEVKICPECAETIKLKAKKCRYCHTTFDSSDVEKQIETRRAELTLQNINIQKQSPDSLTDKVQPDKITDGKSSDELFIEQITETKAKSRSKTKIAYTILYYFILLIMVYATVNYFLFPQKSTDSLNFIIWMGIFGAWTAKRRNKSGWAGFIIGLILVGVPIVFIGTAYQSYTAARTDPVRTELQQLEPMFKKASLRNFQSAFSKLDEVDITTLPNIKKAIQIIDSCHTEISKVEINYNQLIEFFNKYSDEILKDEKLSPLGAIVVMNSKVGSLNHLQEYKNLLKAYKEVLVYSRNNFDNILNGKEPEISEYNKLFESYEKATKKLNDATIKKEKAVEAYLKTHPELLKYIKQAQNRLDNVSPNINIP